MKPPTSYDLPIQKQLSFLPDGWRTWFAENSCTVWSEKNVLSFWQFLHFWRGQKADSRGTQLVNWPRKKIWNFGGTCCISTVLTCSSTLLYLHSRSYIRLRRNTCKNKGIQRWSEKQDLHWWVSSLATGRVGSWKPRHTPRSHRSGPQSAGGSRPFVVRISERKSRAFYIFFSNINFWLLKWANEIVFRKNSLFPWKADTCFFFEVWRRLQCLFPWFRNLQDDEPRMELGPFRSSLRSFTSAVRASPQAVRASVLQAGATEAGVRFAWWIWWIGSWLGYS